MEPMIEADGAAGADEADGADEAGDKSYIPGSSVWYFFSADSQKH